MKRVALLVFGQFRTASIILQHNLKEIKKSFNNQTDIIYDVYILTDRDPRGNYSDLTVNRVQNIFMNEQVEIKLISYWEDLVWYHKKDKEIMNHFISIGEGKAGWGDKMWFTANMWYRRYVLWELFLGSSVEEYDYILLCRLFDTKIISLRPILLLENDINIDNTIYFCMDTLVYGRKEILNVFLSSFNDVSVWTDFEWTDEFRSSFASFDSCLAYHKPTFCSEAQVFNFIWRTFPFWKNIRWDYNAIDSPCHMDALFHIFHVPDRETFKEK